jgi:hypothetical protein
LPGQNTEIKVETFNFTRCGLPFWRAVGPHRQAGQQQSALPIAPCGPSQPSASSH